RIGVLISASPSAATSRVKAFQLGLHELGYVEGKNIITDYRYAEGKPDTLPALVDELMLLRSISSLLILPTPLRQRKMRPKPFPLSSPWPTIPLGIGRY